jgi:putative hydrolases of HD superfamily
MQRVVSTLKLDDMIQFSRLMLKFQSVERAIHVPGIDRNENDVEHSYQLAMMAWYLNNAGNLGLDTDKIIRYALVHDLPETLAGDVHAYDPQARKGKAERERQALKVLHQEYPEAAEIIEAVHIYDRLEDPEARYIYALDKIMPMVLVYLDGGRAWREYGLTAEQLHANKLDKVALSQPVKELYDQLVVLLERNPQLFSNISAL